MSSGWNCSIDAIFYLEAVRKELFQGKILENVDINLVSGVTDAPFDGFDAFIVDWLLPGEEKGRRHGVRQKLGREALIRMRYLAKSTSMKIVSNLRSVF